MLSDGIGVDHGCDDFNVVAGADDGAGVDVGAGDDGVGDTNGDGDGDGNGEGSGFLDRKTGVGEGAC